MTTYNWQLSTPIDAVVFDCDGTLSKLEGIDELAKNNQVGDIVASMTAQAMAYTGMSPELYARRLDLVKPHFDQLIELGKQYYQQKIPEVSEVITILRRLHKTVYIVSAGLLPSVAYFSDQLNIPLANVYAVNATFDAQGNYLHFDETSPLVYSKGKRVIINQLKKQHQTILHIGDGLNDFEVYDLVTRFIGFGGVYYRENIAAQCQYYIKAMSMAPLLPLALTQNEYDQLSPEEMTLYQKGLCFIQNDQVITRSYINSPSEVSA